MKTFWIVVLVLAVAAGGAWYLRSAREVTKIPVGEVTRLEAPSAMSPPAGAARKSEPLPAIDASAPKIAGPAADAAKLLAPVQAAEPAQLPEPVQAIEPARETEPVRAIDPERAGAGLSPSVAGAAEPVPASSPAASPAESVDAATTPAPEEKTPGAVKPEPAESNEPAAAPPVSVPESHAPGSTEPARADDAADVAQAVEPAGPVDPATNQPAAAAVKSDVPAAPAGSGEDGNPPEHAMGAEPVQIEKRADGSMLVDGKYEMRGEGTAQSPYEVTWDMLLSSQETYQPKQGMKIIPGRLSMLDGKHVRVTGYVTFPLYVQEAREMLSMLNQWDGCCIGVPPTPYDAIEVRLKEAVGEADRFATFGTVEGKFGVKPYVVGDWLVGLYVMDDAKFDGKRFGGFGGS